MSVTNDAALTLISKGLDALSARQSVISHNLANVETPNYKAADVSFEKSLRQWLNRGESAPMARTNERHFSAGGPPAGLEDLGYSVFRRNQTSLRKDGNNVDVDLEMVRLAETGLRFQSLSVLASKKLALLRTVVQEAR